MKQILFLLGLLVFNTSEAQNFQLFSWGNNDYSHSLLGLGDTANESKYNSPRKIGADSNWSIVSTNELVTIAIKKDGSLWSWGEQREGELGLGIANKFITPNPMRIGNDNNWVSISTFTYHSIALKSNGTLWAWGAESGGDTINQNRPMQIGSETNWKSITAGGGFSIALKNDGTLWSWGGGAEGQLGLGNYEFYRTPQKIGNETNWKYVSAGLDFTIAIKNDGTLWGWGYNGNGQLGIGNDTPYNVNRPKQIGKDTNWSIISTGSRFTIALKNDCSLWSWGHNGFGQLGLGNMSNSNTPKLLNNEKDWSFICAAAFHASALKKNGTLWNWGNNDWGQLGNGNFVSTNTPNQMGIDSNWIILGHGASMSTFGIKKIAQKTVSINSKKRSNEIFCEVHPNPSSEFLLLSNKKNTQIDFKIYSQNGILIKSGFTFEKIDISQINTGFYFLKTNVGDFKFVKE